MDIKYHKAIKDLALPLSRPDDLEPLINKLASKKVVMLGESTHGTSEFYQWRNVITQQLIENHDFKFIAVEGDWPSCQSINRYIGRGDGDSAMEVLSAFTRWPTWMWANMEVVELIGWLWAQNSNLKKDIGFYGLDVYSMYESMDRVIQELRQIDEKLALKAIELYSCLGSSYNYDEMSYARSLLKTPEGCQKGVLEVLNTTLDLQSLDIVQNAKIVKNAENYYRAMIFGDDNSWNIRDRHMMETLESLLQYHGEDAKAIIWAHNTHIGDYKATDMLERGEVNLGGLAREKFGEEHVALIGFGTNSGTVIASHSWDGPVQTLTVPPGREDSVEFEFHHVSRDLKYPVFFTLFEPGVASVLSDVKDHRAIGVVYDPEGDYRRNYVPTSLARRYDAFIFVNESHALSPLGVPYDCRKIPETYPYGSRI